MCKAVFTTDNRFVQVNQQVLPNISREYLDATLTKTSDCTYQARGLTRRRFKGINE